jgi:hypothetical protein
MMNKALTSALTSYREFRAAKARNRPYRVIRGLIVSLVTAYLLLLCFPQVLFANEVSYKNFTVYSTEPLGQNVYAVLDRVEARLSASTINNQAVKPQVFLINSHRVYKVMSLFIGGNSFGKGFPALPTSNIFINRSDLATDLVFRDAPADNQRSLSGVISHETTHLLIRKRFGYWKNLTMPVWKREGYCEYVAGGSTLNYETGVNRWKANPKDGTGYQYFKYYMLVKYLLEHEKMSVDDFFKRDHDLPALEAKVLSSL